MSRLVKPALAVALVFVLIRIVLEQAGLSGPVAAAFGVTWLQLILPIAFAYTIARSGTDIPFKSLLMSVAVFSLVARVIVAISYSLAYILNLSGPRFEPLAAESFLQGAVVLPLTGLLLTAILGTLIGFLIGALALLVWRKVLA